MAYKSLLERRKAFIFQSPISKFQVLDYSFNSPLVCLRNPIYNN